LFIIELDLNIEIKVKNKPLKKFPKYQNNSFSLQHLTKFKEFYKLLGAEFVRVPECCWCQKQIVMSVQKLARALVDGN
jgi:hypothetical protein